MVLQFSIPLTELKKWDLPKHQFLYPFAKFQYYDGGKKYEKDARSYVVRDYEIGVEWQPIKALELTAEYVIADRTFEDSALPIKTLHCFPVIDLNPRPLIVKSVGSSELTCLGDTLEISTVAAVINLVQVLISFSFTNGNCCW